ncbi:aminopeptidase [Deinococcus cellulosilyticus]|uniref:Aminopeptidase n=1 Tax=Deinococcus cellulosilyticus (strain DSM 18568 / NBRC 106333 / KACC 11606 / 5516J-15) TaxID=1223518 RepID=A0A511MVL9_DEIC1|nr:aminopeptidase [Deinococcus cellulosilyticus]GEM44625.1 aminopeptidase [Deinococcus cellulosilyticus NBRC 106333 = KACC 11606]
MLTFEQKLRNYAEIALHIGLGIQPGQRLLITCPIDGAQLARKVTELAYQAGACIVEVLWEDDAVLLSRFQHSSIQNFDEVSWWRGQIHLEYAQSGDPILSIRASDPGLLKGQDPEKVNTLQMAVQASRKEYLKHVYGNTFPWSIVAVPIPGWSSSVFPDLPAAEQHTRMWDAIFAATRADQPDALELWREHIAALGMRAAALNAKQYTALHFRSAGTDLMVGLPENHSWESALHHTTSGLPFFANIPSEEVFTLPHREKVDGVVRNTRPLSHMGQLIDGFELTFKNGQVVDFRAKQGEDALGKLLATDEGATHLGEVALVSASSPIQQSGILFYTTLFDENAASHLAFGQAYPGNLRDGQDLSPEAFQARGGNRSLIHVDFMMGSEDMDVDGILLDGTHEPVMHHGEFVF